MEPSSVETKSKKRELLFEDIHEGHWLPRLLHKIGEKDETLSSMSAKVVFFRATVGEFLCTSIFLFVAMAVPWNMTRLGVEYSELEALAVGFIGIAMIYSFADISGANFNPAVTFATIVTGKTTWQKGIAYICAQLLGSCFASFWFIISFPDGSSRIYALALTPSPDISVFHHIMMEFTLTFILVYVIFSVAFDTIDSSKVEIKQIPTDLDSGTKNVQVERMVVYQTTSDSKAGFAPISIGFQLGLLSLVGGSVSGGAYNPARAFGAAMLSGVWGDQYIIWIGDFAGAACAGFLQMGFQKARSIAGRKEAEFQEKLRHQQEQQSQQSQQLQQPQQPQPQQSQQQPQQPQQQS